MVNNIKSNGYITSHYSQAEGLPRNSGFFNLSIDPLFIFHHKYFFSVPLVHPNSLYCTFNIREPNALMSTVRNNNVDGLAFVKNQCIINNCYIHDTNTSIITTSLILYELANDITENTIQSQPVINFSQQLEISPSEIHRIWRKNYSLRDLYLFLASKSNLLNIPSSLYTSHIAQQQIKSFIIYLFSNKVDI